MQVDIRCIKNHLDSLRGTLTFSCKKIPRARTAALAGFRKASLRSFGYGTENAILFSEIFIKKKIKKFAIIY